LRLRSQTIKAGWKDSLEVNRLEGLSIAAELEKRNAHQQHSSLVFQLNSQSAVQVKMTPTHRHPIKPASRSHTRFDPRRRRRDCEQDQRSELGELGHTVVPTTDVAVH
jgi:hypothetical protein